MTGPAAAPIIQPPQYLGFCTFTCRCRLSSHATRGTQLHNATCAQHSSVRREHGLFRFDYCSGDKGFPCESEDDCFEEEDDVEGAAGASGPGSASGANSGAAAPPAD